jgi:hypothetical protein
MFVYLNTGEFMAINPDMPLSVRDWRVVAKRVDDRRPDKNKMRAPEQLNQLTMEVCGDSWVQRGLSGKELTPGAA